MKFGLRRWVRGFAGLIRYGGLIGVHGSATVVVAGEFQFGKGVSIGRSSLIQVPRNSVLRLGAGVHVGREAEISSDPRIVIGDFTSVQDRCILLGDLEVGANCLFAPNVMVSSGTHHFKEKPAWLIRDQDRLMADPEYSTTTPRHLKIRIADDCWIGINSVIMRGVSIGRGSIVGANSVVTQSFPPYSIVAGSPARLIDRRLAFAPPRKIAGSNRDHLPYFYSGFDLRQATLSAFPNGVRASGQFQVALDCSSSKAIGVDLECDRPVVLKLFDQQKTLEPGIHNVSFALEGDPREGFLSLDVSDAAGRPYPVTIHGLSAES